MNEQSYYEMQEAEQAGKDAICRWAGYCDWDNALPGTDGSTKATQGPWYRYGPKHPECPAHGRDAK